MAEEAKKGDANVNAAENTNGAEGSSIIGSVMAMASAGLAKAQEIDNQYKISEQAMATAAAGVQKAKEIDEQYKVTEQAKAAVGAAVGKAKELDAKYQITEKAAKVAETSAAAVSAADQKLGVSKKVAAGAEIIKQKDEEYGVSKKVKAKVGEVDKALGVSEKVLPMVAQADQALGVSKKMEAAKNGAMAMMGIYKGNAKIDDEADFVPISVAAKSRTLTFKDQSVVIPDDFEPKAEGEKVSMGNFTLTFATPDEAVQFVTFVSSKCKESKKEEEEVQGIQTE